MERQDGYFCFNSWGHAVNLPRNQRIVKTKKPSQTHFYNIEMDTMFQTLSVVKQTNCHTMQKNVQLKIRYRQKPRNNNLGNLTVNNLQYKQVQQSPLDAISFGFTATLFVILYVL